MNEHPIIFSSKMVRAILEDRKTQTRRIMKWTMGSDVAEYRLTKDNILYMEHLGGGTTYRPRACQYGIPGDRLWVKETWKIASFMEGEPLRFQYQSDGGESDENDCWDQLRYGYEKWFERVNIQSTDYLEKIKWPNKDAEGIYRWDNGKSPLPWRSPIFMPRWASRIALEIVKVRLERVKEISEKDCCLETGSPVKWPGPGLEPYKRDMRKVFSILWDSINAKRGYGWDVNPWVWVIEFKKLEVGK